eukprot:CAMPEP_0178446836 /NCGR_PEP_ID=MMETSP0689_2-20121128/41042_1 /TAXON_ID=160604 /ORGANISM="Amphidinium massartii, Strain CS-259" /LENGTH=41 /DNA_ID= /DNA_START= /DNA_END= /DNA_ORIENTATION=
MTHNSELASMVGSIQLQRRTTMMMMASTKDLRAKAAMILWL